MAAIITEKFRVHNARQFKEDFGEAASSTFIFIGRSFDWADENSPPTPVNSVRDEIDSYADMIAMKKVASSDVSHALSRRDWASGTSYDEYADDYSASNLAPASSANNLYDSRFYVITDEYNVYKCIRTGRDSSGAVVNSTVKPTGTATSPFAVQDTDAASGRGYMWKYMYSVSASDTIKFVTNDFIPVKTIGAQTEVFGDVAGVGSAAADDGSTQWDVENGAIDGGIHHIKVVNGGSGYTNGTYTNVNIVGDGSGAQCTVTVEGGAIVHAQIESAEEGTGYRRAEINVADISGIGSGTSGDLKPIVSPIYGHGADPVVEMGGNYVIVNSRLEFAEGSGDFPTDNDFRRVGLIQDPFQDGTTTISTDATLMACNKIVVASASGLGVDDVITNAAVDASGVAVGRIVSISGTNIFYTPVTNAGNGYNDFAGADTVYVSGSSVTTVSSVDSDFPEVERYSGNIMYLENRGAVTRASDQIEDIKLIIEM